MRKLLRTTLVAGFMVSLGFTSAFAEVTNTTLPTWSSGTNVNYTETINGTTSSLGNVQITGGQGSVGTANWSSYNIGKDATVNYEFTATNQTALNIIDKASGISEIYGNITNSSCTTCAYTDTGKVILINPNGFLFGDGANVNLNSFTVTTFDGTYNKDDNTLKLTRSSDSGDIVIEGGANIYGDKNVTLAASNITTYAGSKISTNIDQLNGWSDADGDDLISPTTDKPYNAVYGRVKLVTSDGVTFTYYNNGAVKDVSDITTSTDKMVISLGGDIDSGHIDVRNYSTNSESEISVNNSVLKATKASSANDGNIWLTSQNAITLADAELEAGGNVLIQSGKDTAISDSTIDAANNITITSSKSDIIFDGTTSLNAGGKIKLTAGNDVKTKGSAILNLNNKKTYITAGNDIDVYLEGVESRDYGLVAEAGNNVTIETPGTLSVSRLVAKNGDMTLTADKIIAGLDYTDETKLDDDLTSDRSYIEVANGTFTSNTANDSYTTTASGDSVEVDGNYYYTRHHIEYGDGAEKILLVTNVPYTPAVTPEPVVVPSIDSVTVAETTLTTASYDGDQASMLNKIPRQPEIFNNKTVIKDGRTSFVDVFAAASQIEIADDAE